MRFTLTLVIGCLFPTLILAQSGDCVRPQTRQDVVPVIKGTPMPPVKMKHVTPEDRDRFAREHPTPPERGTIPFRSLMTPEEREAAWREGEAERLKHPHGRPPELFEPHTAAEQRRAPELVQQKPCPPQERETRRTIMNLRQPMAGYRLALFMLATSLALAVPSVLKADSKSDLHNGVLNYRIFSGLPAFSLAPPIAVDSKITANPTGERFITWTSTDVANGTNAQARYIGTGVFGPSFFIGKSAFDSATSYGVAGTSVGAITPL